MEIVMQMYSFPISQIALARRARNWLSRLSWLQGPRLCRRQIHARIINSNVLRKYAYLMLNVTVTRRRTSAHVGHKSSRFCPPSRPQRNIAPPPPCAIRKRRPAHLLFGQTSFNHILDEHRTGNGTHAHREAAAAVWVFWVGSYW